MQPGVFPGTTPYQRPIQPVYPQPLPQQPARQVTSLPRPLFEPQKPQQAVAVETLPPSRQSAFVPIEIPAPSQIGIRLDEPTSNSIVVPEPAKLGIKIE